MNLLKTTTTTFLILLGSLMLLACQAQEDGQTAPPTAPLEAEADIAELPVADRLNRISVAPDGSEANGPSINPALSAEGHFVAFESRADNLGAEADGSTTDIFIHDRQTGQTMGVSTALAENDYYDASLTEEGQIVAFAGNNIFIYDLTSEELVSLGGDLFSEGPDLSENGQVVAFMSNAASLVENDTNGVRDVFVYELAAGAE